MTGRKKTRICFRKIILLLLALAVTAGGGAPKACAEEAVWIAVDFTDPGSNEVWTWEFPYSDEWFLESDDVFNRELAKGSLGLTVSAFMPLAEQKLDPQFEIYLSGAGFGDIHTFGYDQPAGIDTFAGILGRKEFDGFTLIAVTGRGRGYGKEWGGNLRLGTGSRHEGFSIGTGILEEELDRYLADYPVKGPVKLWVSGYSRSSAAGNLAAADWTASGRFEAVYGYFFACPRNTLEPLRAPNLFNICGAQDFVTQVPMQAYGYERNGTDLFLPSAETVSDFGQLKNIVSDTAVKLTGRKLTNNPEMNLLLRLTISLLSGIFQTREEYATLLQDKLLASIPEGNMASYTAMLPGMVISFLTLNLPEGRSFFTTALAELAAESTLLLTFGKDSRIEEGTWDPDANLFVNVFREHLMSTYICWLFSGLPDEEILREATPGRILFLNPCTTLTVYRENEPAWILKDGEVRKTTEEAAGFVHRMPGGTMMLMLPTDDSYWLEGLTEDGTLYGLEAMITPARTLCDSCICYLSGATEAGRFEIAAVGPEPFTDVSGNAAALAHAEISCTADDLIDLFCVGFSKENREKVCAAFEE